MSYILDALQKSEQDRQNQQTPSLTTQYETKALTIKKTNWIWWLIGVLSLALIALVVAVIVWFLNPNESRQNTVQQSPLVAVETPPQTPAQTATPVQPAAHASSSDASTPKTDPLEINTPESTSTADSIASPTLVSQEDQRQAKAAAIDPRIAELYTAPKAVEPEFVYADEKEYQLSENQPPQAVEPKKITSAPVAKGNPESQPGPAVVTEETAVDTAPIAQADNPVPGSVVDGGFMSIEQLPDTVKSEIPAIRYVAHVYAGTQKKGFAILNDAKLQAGDKLDDELYLEKVDKDHIVMSYRGYFFRLPAMQNWDAN